MMFGQTILILAAVAGAAATLASALQLARPGLLRGRVPMWGWLAAAGLSWLSFLWLLWQFIEIDVSYEYVFLYTSDAMPLRYRLAGAWTGREGSLLLWTAYMATAAALFLRQTGDRARAWAGLFLGLIGTAFMVAVATQGLWRPTPEFFLQGRPTGNGLNPLLKSPFIIIHPPLMFLAYALATIPAAVGLGSLFAGGDAWSRLAQQWTRWNWLVFTAAMGLGGIWAYYTLGFGGYWAWDPVEVANLLPWLALTAYMHMQSAHLRHGDFRVAGPLLAVLPFFLTLFSAISTRSGLWFSVHAFTDPTNTFNPDAAARFLGILDAEPLVAFFTAMGLGVLLFALAAWSRRTSLQLGTARPVALASAVVLAALAATALVDVKAFLAGTFEIAHRVSAGRTAIGLLGMGFGMFLVAAVPVFTQRTDEKPRSGRLSWLNERTLIQLSALLLGTGTMLLFLFHMQAVNGWNRAFYDVRFPWLITPLIVALMWLFLTPHHGRKTALGFSLAALGIALVVAVVASATAYLITLSVLLVGAAFDDLVHTSTQKSSRQRLSGGLLLAAAILNVIFWINPPTIRLGFTWQPVWPTQLVMGAIAIYVLVQAHRLVAGRRIARPGHLYLLTGLMGGYYVAPVLAVVAWRTRPADEAPAKANVSDVRMRRSATHGLHFVVALGLLAFTLSTYLETEETVMLRPGETATIGGTSIEHLDTATTMEDGTPWVETITPRFRLDERTPATGYLYWEPQKDHYDPLPIATRQWNRDTYIDVQGVCIDSTAVCGASGDWIQQHGAAGQRITSGQEITAVEARILDLPAVGVVWAAWILGVTYSAMLVATTTIWRRSR